MLTNYIKIAFRNLNKNKGFTAINIIGLAIGMATSILILLWVNSQLNFDNTYPKSKHIYTVGSMEQSNDGPDVWFSTPKPLYEVVQNDISEVKQRSRLNFTGGFLFAFDDKKIIAKKGAFVDSAFLQLFDLPLLKGNPKTALVEPTDIVLTKDYAMTIFGSTDVIGKSIKVDSIEVLKVSAILDEIPSNSRFADINFFVPWTWMEKINFSDQNWKNSSVHLFVELYADANLNTVQQKFKTITQKHSDLKTENFLKQIGDNYLYNDYKNGIAVGGRIDMVKIFIIIAGFILLIACINFMNLSTAQSERRAKEVGIRKVVGAKKRTLISQFLSESILLATISGILALVIVVLLISPYSELVGRKLNLPVSNVYFWLSFIGFILLTGILAGSYPAFFLSSFQPIKVLKGKFVQLQQKVTPRKILVVTQFAIAIIMIISTLVIRKQIDHAQNRDAGFEKENLIYIAENGDIKKNMELIKNELLSRGIAISVSRTMSPITERWSGWNGFSWEGKDPNSVITFNRQSTDDKVVETLGLRLISGRDFDLKKYPTDSMSAIINESAAKIMNLENPIGTQFVDADDRYTIIGVIKDFIQESPFQTVTPTVIEGANMWLNTINIKFNPKLTTQDALSRTEEVFKKYNPNYPFDYQFLDEAYAKKFEETQKTGKLATIFAGLTIFISCLGLFGLAAYMAESRTKEIGIRKVLGASIFTVTQLLSKEFFILIAISCLLSFPIAYWAMNKFLDEYTYRTSISWEIFLFASLGAILLTLISVSYQSIKAAIANPVDSLRDE